MTTGLRLILDKDTSCFKSHERTDLFRYAFLNLCESIHPDLEKAFNFRKEGFPDVIYQKPYKSNMNLFIKEHSYPHALLDKALYSLKGKSLLIKGEEFKIVDCKKIYDNQIMPSYSESIITYKGITPILLFTGEHFPIFYAINKNFTNESQKIQELKSKAIDLIKSNLKWQVQQQIGYRNLDVFDSIDIEWEAFDIKMITFHKDEKKTPAIFGSFKTNWNLPRFIGQKIGKGFGQINKFAGAE